MDIAKLDSKRVVPDDNTSSSAGRYQFEYLGLHQILSFLQRFGSMVPHCLIGTPSIVIRSNMALLLYI